MKQLTQASVYRPHVTADQIVLDGWSRGFSPDQTLEELQAHGCMPNRAALLKIWRQLDAELETYYETKSH